MNHPSEWARFFDENTGRYRYKHKGSGVIRDTFMTIGKVLRKLVNLLLKKVRNKYEKDCKSGKNENRCLKIRKRSLQIFYKPKHRKNQTPLRN